MAKGVLIAGVVLGVVGTIWSILMVIAFIVIGAFVGGPPGVEILIPGIGIPLGVVAVVGGVLGKRRERQGSIMMLLAGLGSLLGGFALFVLFSEVRINTEDALILVFLVYWWAVLLAIIGAILFLRYRKAQR